MAFEPTEKCRHFTGIQNDQCAVGVAYDEVRDETVRPHRWPCLRNDCATSCAKKDPFTAEEVAQEEREVGESLERILKARAAIVEATGGRGGLSGTVDCPNCEGTLRYTVASNGHVWAICSTGGCARWME